MPIPEYTKAHKLAVKAYKYNLSHGKYPYLPVLDELLSFTPTAGETDLGLIDIPLERVAGTKSTGRRKAFADNFMPLLEEGTEFADKWISLYRSHIAEGIREPVIACEFMNSYYIIEGNKRISVLKYSGAVNVSGYVTRILPAFSDSEEYRIYQEYILFNKASGINTIYFSKEGCFYRLCELIGKNISEPWNEEERSIFRSCLLHFTEVYQEKGGRKLPLTTGDAFLYYLKVYGYKDMLQKSLPDLRTEISKLWNDLEQLPLSHDVSLVMQPSYENTMSAPQVIIQKLFSPHLKIGFIYHKTAKSSGWTNSHNLGRMHLENQLKDSIETRVYDGIETDEESLAAIEQAALDGCQVIFTTTPRFLGSSIKAGIKYPKLKILNCSLNAYSGHLRTYYGRLYEAKYLVGMLAGILTNTEHIGYIADFPICGAPADINAFSLGVKMVNPEAKIHLVWSTEKDCCIDRIFREANVSHISGRDTISPLNSEKPYGLYNLKNGSTVRLAASIWNWGKFYQRIVQSILNGKWDRTAPDKLGDSINYWWGISSGMIDIICSKSIPERTRSLVELVKKQIISGDYQIFSGDIYDQNHILRNKGQSCLSPAEIIRMDWLADNVIGNIPDIGCLSEEAVAMVKIQGIHMGKDIIWYENTCTF